MLLLLACWAVGAAAQDGLSPEGAVSLVFESEEWDFGRIEESGGKVQHTFRFTNVADHSVSIERVYSSCGCTTGDYSRRAVGAGKSGEFVVEFDPEGRPGRFDKSLTLVYDQGRGRTELRVRGNVKGRERSKADLYPYVLSGGLRADGLYRAMGNVAQGSSRSMTIALYNSSGREVELSLEHTLRSGALEVAVPRHIEGGETALVSLSYVLDGEQGARYGLLRDSIYVVVDGRRAVEPIVTTAIGVDNFQLGEGRRYAGGKLRLSTSYHDFGSARVGQELTTTIELHNEGTAPVVVRSVTPRAYTSVDLAEGTVIGAGESLEVPMTLRVAEGSYDVLFGGVMLVVSDSQRPVREIRLAAEVK